MDEAAARAASSRTICASAIQNDEFELHYQPIIDVKTRQDLRRRGAGPLAPSGSAA